MGCGGSAASPGTSPSAPAKEEPVVAFQAEPDVDEDDDIESITPVGHHATQVHDGRNSKSAMAFAHNPTPEETQAAIERSLTLNPGRPASPLTIESPNDSRMSTDVVALIDEPIPFNLEQSPRSSPRTQKSVSVPDRFSPPAARAKLPHSFEEQNDNYEKKHYFPDASPTWGVKADDKDRSTFWSSSAPDDKPSAAGAKRDPLFPSIAVHAQPTLARDSDVDSNAHLPSIFGSEGKPEPVQLAVLALEQKKMREEHEKNMGSLAYIENYRSANPKAGSNM